RAGRSEKCEVGAVRRSVGVCAKRRARELHRAEDRRPCDGGVSVMKTTRYFEGRVMRKRPYLKGEWCERGLRAPIRIELQEDGRIRHWVFTEEAGYYLRVVTLEDRETVHNAFPDRDFAEDA